MAMGLIASGGLRDSESWKYLLIYGPLLAIPIIIPLALLLVARKGSSFRCFIFGVPTSAIGILMVAWSIYMWLVQLSPSRVYGSAVCSMLPYGLVLAAIGAYELKMGIDKRRSENAGHSD